ncbi:MAG: O-antigen ligase family protein [Elusimicrobiota bacterium]|nr:O-antigen ligase family protein [Elusimicrobiota bacterium]
MSNAPALRWSAAAAAYWFLPDRKVVRWKLVGVEAFVLVAGLWALALALRRRGDARRASLDLPVALLAASIPAFFLLSPERAASEGEAARLGLCVAAYFAASRTLDAAGVRRLAAAWTLGGALAAALALAQRLGLPGFAALERPTGSFGNPIFLGAALAAAVPVAAALALGSAGRTRALWSAVAGLQVAGLLATRSRGPALGLLAAGAVWAVLRLEGRARAAAVAGAAALAATGAALSAGREWTHGLIWRDAWSLFAARPLLGSGLGRFHLEFPAYASEALKARWPEGRVIVNFAHNEYLQTLCETGLVGLGLLLLIPATAAAVIARRRGSPYSEADAGLLAGLVFFVCAAVSPDARFGVSAFAAFLWLGAAAALAATPARPLPRPALPLAAAALLAWASLAARPLRAARANAAEKPFAASSPELDARIRSLEEELRRRPDAADTAEALAYLYAKDGAWERAIARFELAARLDPGRPGPLNNLGNVHYTLGAFDRAAEYWERSLAVAPGQLDARLNLAKLHYERGRLKQASAQLEEVLRRDPGNAKARVLHKRMIE